MSFIYTKKVKDQLYRYAPSTQYIDRAHDSIKFGAKEIMCPGITAWIYKNIMYNLHASLAGMVV